MLSLQPTERTRREFSDLGCIRVKPMGPVGSLFGSVLVKPGLYRCGVGSGISTILTRPDSSWTAPLFRETEFFLQPEASARDSTEVVPSLTLRATTAQKVAMSNSLLNGSRSGNRASIGGQKNRTGSKTRPVMFVAYSSSSSAGSSCLDANKTALRDSFTRFWSSTAMTLTSNVSPILQTSETFFTKPSDSSLM